MRKFHGLLFLILLVATGCDPVHNSFSRPGLSGTNGNADSPDLEKAIASPDSIAFATVEKFVIKDSCLACHDSVIKKDGVDLSTYESILAGIGGRKFVEPFSPLTSPLYTVLKAEGARHMPPLSKPQLNDKQIQLVYLWIERGAKQIAEAPVPKPPPSLKEQLQTYFDHPENVDYKVIREHVLALNCTKCHSIHGETPDPNAIDNFANLTDYASLFNVFTPVIVKGKPAVSELYQSIALTQRMPPPSKGYDVVEALRVKLMRIWILNCAIEDKAALGNEILTPDPDNPEKVRTCDP